MNKTKTTNILLVGVGGQGIILASKILAFVVMKNGYDVKISEIHGMSQRGGSVYSMVRFGKKVYSPIISEGEADYIVAFEFLEAIRWMSFLNPADGTMLVNNQKIKPMPVLLGQADYPKDIKTQLERECKNLIIVDALEKAKTAGGIRTVNMVMLGSLAKVLPVQDDVWDEVISKNVPKKTLNMNKKAFNSGKQLVKEVNFTKSRDNN